MVFNWNRKPKSSPHPRNLTSPDPILCETRLVSYDIYARTHALYVPQSVLVFYNFCVGQVSSTTIIVVIIIVIHVVGGTFLAAFQTYTYSARRLAGLNCPTEIWITIADGVCAFQLCFWAQCMSYVVHRVPRVSIKGTTHVIVSPGYTLWFAKNRPPQWRDETRRREALTHEAGTF